MFFSVCLCSRNEVEGSTQAIYRGGRLHAGNGETSSEAALFQATRPTTAAAGATSCTGGWNGQRLPTPFPATVAPCTDPRRTMCATGGRRRAAAASATVGSGLSSGRGAARCSIGQRHFGADYTRGASSPRLFHANLRYALRFFAPMSRSRKVFVSLSSKNLVRNKNVIENH